VTTVADRAGQRARRDLVLVGALVLVAAVAELMVAPLQRATIFVVRYEELFVAELLVILFAATVGMVFYAVRRLGDARRFQAESAELRTSVDEAKGLNRRYRNYAEAVLHGQEEERMRLARDLHDDSIHRLILLGQRLELARLDHAPSPADDDLAIIQQIVNDTIANMRLFIQELRPTFLEELGLVPALRALVTEKSERTGVDITLEVRGSSVRLDEGMEVTLYRIAQTALRNVVLHAQGESARVCLDIGDDAIDLVIEDDGVGFEAPTDRGREIDSDHFGLLGMRERAELQGGRFWIDSSLGQGTTVRVTLPRAADDPSRSEVWVDEGVG
jgi:signal transduction histidine kinase